MRLAREEQRLWGLLELKGLESQTMSGMIDEASRLRKERFKLMEVGDRLKAENKVALR